MQIRRNLAMVSVVALAACATTGQQHIDQGRTALTASTKVLKSPKDLPFQEVKFGEVQKFELMQTAYVLQEGGTRRFVQGFRLPLDKKPLSLRIGSYRVGTVTDPAIFYPEVRVLDSNFQLVRTYAPDEFSYRVTQEGSGLFATLFFNSGNDREAYVLVSNREPADSALKMIQDNVSSSTVIAVPVGVGMVFWAIPTGFSSKPIKMRASQEGKIEVLIEQYKPKIIGQD